MLANSEMAVKKMNTANVIFPNSQTSTTLKVAFFAGAKIGSKIFLLEKIFLMKINSVESVGMGRVAWWVKALQLESQGSCFKPH